MLQVFGLFQAIICVFLALYGGLFILGTARIRALLVILSLFVANLEVEIGIGLNAASLLAILSVILLLAGKVAIHPRCLALFRNRLFLFLAWTFAIWVIGVSCLELVSDAQFGWTRNSNVRPFIQLVRCAMLVPLALVVSDGIRSKADAAWLFTNWSRIAVVSATICLTQFCSNNFAGFPWGVYRARSGEFELSFVEISGRKVPRANGMAGEPKAQGKAMAISLCMLLGTYGRGLVAMSRPLHLLCIAIIEVALLLTWSSGAFLMVAVLFGVIAINGRMQPARAIVAAHVGLLALAVVLFPALANEIWSSRLQRIVDIAVAFRSPAQDTEPGLGEEKEFAALQYLLANPRVAIAGVGIGSGPYYFNPLIRNKDFRRKYVDPNSGILWSIYGFGIIGCCLLLAGLLPELRGVEMGPDTAPAVVLLLRFTMLYFLVFTPLYWFAIMLGLCCAPGTQQDAESVAQDNPLSQTADRDGRAAA